MTQDQSPGGAAVQPLQVGTFDLQAQVSIWRDKCRNGTMTQDEYKLVIASLRAGRKLADQPKAGSRAKSAKAPARSADDLLAGLDDL